MKNKIAGMAAVAIAISLSAFTGPNKRKTRHGYLLVPDRRRYSEGLTCGARSKC
jgi:hypothetical protein